jgi:hypothetical protein
MKPFKQCKCGRLCATGYCSECRTKDDTVRTIKAREIMDRKKEANKVEQFNDSTRPRP